MTCCIRVTRAAIFDLRQLMKKQRKGNENLHYIFIDLEKAYDSAKSRSMEVSEFNKVDEKCIRLVKNVYEDCKKSGKFVRNSRKFSGLGRASRRVGSQPIPLRNRMKFRRTQHLCMRSSGA